MRPRHAHFWISMTAAVICVCTMGCRENDVAPEAPVLTLIDVSPTTVTAHQDSVRIRLQYSDAQGDIGFVDPDVPSLSVRDQRLQEADWVHIPPVTPDLMALSVSGELDLVLSPLFLLGNGSQENTTLTLQLFDREGHASEALITPVITILDTL